MDRRGAPHLVVAGRPLAGGQPGQRPVAPRARHHARLAGDRRADRVGGASTRRSPPRSIRCSRPTAGGSPTRRRATTSRRTSTSSRSAPTASPAARRRCCPTAARKRASPSGRRDGRSLLLIDGVPSSNGGVVRVPVDGSRRPAPLAGLEHAGSLALAARRRPPRLPSSRHRRRHLAHRPAGSGGERPRRAVDAVGGRRRPLARRHPARVLVEPIRRARDLGRRRLRRSRAAADHVRRAGAGHRALVARSAAGRVRRPARRQLGHLRRRRPAAGRSAS